MTAPTTCPVSGVYITVCDGCTPRYNPVSPQLHGRVQLPGLLLPPAAGPALPQPRGGGYPRPDEVGLASGLRLSDGSEQPRLVSRCTIEKVRDDGVYLLDNGMHMLLFVGLAANPAFIQVTEVVITTYVVVDCDGVDQVVTYNV